VFALSVRTSAVSADTADSVAFDRSVPDPYADLTAMTRVSSVLLNVMPVGARVGTALVVLPVALEAERYVLICSVYVCPLVSLSSAETPAHVLTG